MTDSSLSGARDRFSRDEDAAERLAEYRLGLVTRAFNTLRGDGVADMARDSHLSVRRDRAAVQRLVDAGVLTSGGDV